MDNSTVDKPQGDESCQPEYENKRKRRYSTQSDESPKRKTLHIEVEHDIASARLKTYGDGDIADEHVILNKEVSKGNVEVEPQFSVEELCDEVLYEIFKCLDTWSLMALMKRFQKFVLDKRLWENIDLCKEPLPLGILEDMLERSHEKTKNIKLKGPPPSQHIVEEIKHFTKTLRNSFTTRCTKLVTLELYGVTLDFNQISIKDFPISLKRLVLNTCNVSVVTNKSLFTGIDTILVNLKELAIENNSWFDPYYVMPLSKLPLLRYLSLKGCWQMQQFIPYGSIAARHGFKQLEILDLRDTPLTDSDLQCFNAVETLKEIYLQCPEDEEENEQASSSTKKDSQNLTDTKKPTASNEVSLNIETASSSMAASKDEGKHEKPDEALATPNSLSINDSESMSSNSISPISLSPISSSSTSSSSSISSQSSSSPLSNSLSSSSSSDSGNMSENNTAARTTPHSRFSLSRNVVPLVGTNSPPRSRFLPRPDHIFYLDARNRTSPNAANFNIRDHNNVRHLRGPGQAHVVVINQQPSPPPVIEQMMRHNLFWEIVNPLGRVVGVGGPDRLLGEENDAEYHLNLFSLSNRQPSRGTISDRGVCSFGRTRQPVQQGVIWIRFNNRPSENRFERFSVRHYKFVTDVSLQHLVQCSPYLTFLDVSGTSVTLEGLQRFKDLKPECKVVAEHLLNITGSDASVS